MSGFEQFRELTVGELIERLGELPEHYLVTVIVNGTAGVIVDVWEQKLFPSRGDAPHVLIGEREPAMQIVPPDWTQSTPNATDEERSDADSRLCGAAEGDAGARSARECRRDADDAGEPPGC